MATIEVIFAAGAVLLALATVIGLRLPSGPARPSRRPDGTAVRASRGVWKTGGLMEYVILIIVIAVLALGTGGWLLFSGRAGDGPWRRRLPSPR